MKNLIKELNIPSQTTILDELKKSIFTNLNCVNIGTIESFDSSDQTASIQLSIKSIESISPDGTRTLKDRALLEKCPCVVLSGGDSYLTFPIKKGDSCIVLFNDRQIDNWFTSGDGSAPDVVLRKHDLSDGLAIVGIRNLLNKIPDYLEDGARLRFDESSKIEITENKIESTAADSTQNGNMEVTEDLGVGGKADIGGDVGIGGNLTVGGTINGGISGEFTESNFVWTIDKGVVVGVVPVPVP